MKHKRLTVFDEGSTQLPKGWHDEIVVHTFRKNDDGTVSVLALVNVYSPDGKCYSADRTLRLRNNRGFNGHQKNNRGSHG